jgi:alpha-glucosidase
MVWDDVKPNGGFSDAKPWLPVAKEHLPLAVSRQQGDQNSLLEHYRRFLAFRSGHPALVKGEIEFLAVEGDAIAFARKEGNERIVCAFNLGSAPASMRLDAGAGSQALAGHGLSGKAEGSRIDLQGYGAWFGRLE